MARDEEPASLAAGSSMIIVNVRNGAGAEMTSAAKTGPRAAWPIRTYPDAEGPEFGRMPTAANGAAQSLNRTRRSAGEGGCWTLGLSLMGRYWERCVQQAKFHYDKGSSHP